MGDDILVGACMDLHGNVSHDLFAMTDILTCYRMAPHEDAWVTRERAARTLVERVRSGKGKPKKSLVHVPILLPGEKTSTRMQPAARLYDEVAKFGDHTPGVIDASFGSVSRGPISRGVVQLLLPMGRIKRFSTPPCCVLPARLGMLATSLSLWLLLIPLSLR